MGISFFRSKKIGPFKINASSSGIGFSLGVKGARLNFSPRGTFVNIGANGIYYRKKISYSSQEEIRSKMPTPIEVDYSETYDKKLIGTINFEGLTDIDSSEIVAEIERKRKKISILKWFGVVPGIFIFLLLFFQKTDVEQIKIRNITIPTAYVTAKRANIRSSPTANSKIMGSAKREEQFLYLAEEGNWFKITGGNIDTNTAYIHNSLISKRDSVATESWSEMTSEYITNDDVLPLLIPVYCVSFFLLFLLDRKRKRVEIYYAFDDQSEKLYHELIAGFKELLHSKAIWHYSQTAKTRNQKYHAGADTLVARHRISRIAIDGRPLPFFKCNVLVPTIKIGSTEMFFFPERLVLKKGKKFAGVIYKNLFIKTETTQFIESGKVPYDSKIIDYTYKYVNKGGGPDKRFKNNTRIPICLYSQYSVSSNNGIDEIFLTSKLSAMDQFADAICEIQNFEEIIH